MRAKSMSALDEFQNDESYEAFRDGVLNILQRMDDPAEVRRALRDHGFEEAAEHIDTDADELETDLEILQALAREIQNRRPELVDELEDELVDQGTTGE